MLTVKYSIGIGGAKNLQKERKRLVFEHFLTPNAYIRVKFSSDLSGLSRNITAFHLHFRLLMQDPMRHSLKALS